MVIIAVVYFLFSSSGDGGTSGVYTDWESKFELMEKNPRDLYFTTSYLKEKYPKVKFERITTHKQFDSICELGKKPNFILIADTIAFTRKELTLINTSLENGGKMLLAFNTTMGSLFSDFEVATPNRFVFDTSLVLNFPKKKAYFYRIYEMDTLATHWNGWNSAIVPFENRWLVANNLTLVHSKNIGQGKILLCESPELFCNYNLNRPENKQLLAQLAPEFNRNQPFYILDFGIYHYVKEQYDPEEDKNSLFDLILKNKSLLNAFSAILIGVLLFLLFRTRRREGVKTIPAPRPNVTASYVETIASIFRNKDNPEKLFQIQRQSFIDTIQRHFYVDLHRNLDERTLLLLSEKTNYPMKSLVELTNLFFNPPSAFNITYLNSVVNKKLEFYKFCGIITTGKALLPPQFILNRNIYLSSVWVISGILLFFSGLLMLSAAQPAGIFVWILGFLIGVFGVLRLLFPYLKFDKNTLVFVSWYGKKQMLMHQQIESITMNEHRIEFILLLDDKRIKKSINRFDTNSWELDTLKLFINQKNEV